MGIAAEAPAVLGRLDAVTQAYRGEVSSFPPVRFEILRQDGDWFIVAATPLTPMARDRVFCDGLGDIEQRVAQEHGVRVYLLPLAIDE